MRNKLVNKKVVNAIGIGIMAFVTAASPTLTALAVDGEEGGEPGGNTETSGPVETDPVEAPAQNAAVSESIGEAQGAVSDAQDTITNEQIAGETVNDPSVSENLTEADTALGNLNEDIKGENGLDDLNKDAVEKKETWEEKLDDATNGKDGWLDKASSDAAAATDAVKEVVNTTTDDLVDITEDKATEAENLQTNTYENAGAAQTAKDQANTAGPGCI